MNIKMTELAKSFPTLDQAEGIDPWDPEKLEKWATGPKPGKGAFHAACFVLGVWNSDAQWQCGPFNVFDAMGTWDKNHREAFLAWAILPWRP